MHIILVGALASNEIVGVVELHFAVFLLMLVVAVPDFSYFTLGSALLVRAAIHFPHVFEGGL